MPNFPQATSSRTAYNAARYAANPEKVRARSAAYRAANPEKVKAYAATYYAVNLEKERARAAAYHAAHREEGAAYARAYNAAHPEVGAAYQAARAKAHPEMYRASGAARRARKLDAPGTATVAEIAARWTYHGGKCWICGGEATCTDHVKPLAKGGSNWPANLRPACGPCNSSKRDKWPLMVAAQ